MATTEEAWEAGVDAVVADSSLNRGGFADALRTVITARFTDAEAKAWIDAIAVEYNRLGILNNPTYASLRGSINNDGKDAAMALFVALGVAVNALPESVPAIEGASLVSLRDERDQINNAIDRCDVLIAAEPSGTVGRLVKDVLREGKRQLRSHRENVRSAIQAITGDPDA